MEKKQAIDKLVAEVLDGTEMHLKVDSYVLDENFETGQASVRCSVHEWRTGEKSIIQGSGVGLIDAFFNGLVSKYSTQFPSLTTIHFSHFAIKANLDTGKERSRADSAVEVSLSVANSESKEFYFVHSSPSTTRSSMAVVLEAVEFFINSERAFIEVYRALQHSRKTNRPDSLQQYTAQLTVLVEATSYSTVIEHMTTSDDEASDDPLV